MAPSKSYDPNLVAEVDRVIDAAREELRSGTIIRGGHCIADPSWFSQASAQSQAQARPTSPYPSNLGQLTPLESETLKREVTKIFKSGLLPRTVNRDDRHPPQETTSARNGSNGDHDPDLVSLPAPRPHQPAHEVAAKEPLKQDEWNEPTREGVDGWYTDPLIIHSVAPPQRRSNRRPGPEIDPERQKMWTKVIAKQLRDLNEGYWGRDT